MLMSYGHPTTSSIIHAVDLSKAAPELKYSVNKTMAILLMHLCLDAA